VFERTVPAGARTGGLTRYQSERRLVRDILVGDRPVLPWAERLGYAD